MNSQSATVAMEVKNLGKRFTLHQQGGTSFSVFEDFSLKVNRGQCVVLNGQSGKGKSTLLKSLYANYLPDQGEIWFHFDNQSVEILSASINQKIRLRENYIGYVSQFLRAIPRVSALDIVSDPLVLSGESIESAHHQAAEMLTKLNIPQRLWSLSPFTFSGGEQQRINIARGLIKAVPFLLLDEPTASLDEKNRKVVIELIHQAKQRGTAIVGIFHDADVRNAVADEILEL